MLLTEAHQGGVELVGTSLISTLLGPSVTHRSLPVLQQSKDFHVGRTGKLQLKTYTAQTVQQ